jgi:putative ABC transport system permease protein
MAAKTLTKREPLARVFRPELFVLEMRQVCRSLWHSRRFSALVVITVTLGIGASVSMTSLTRRLVASTPPHVNNADRVHRVHQVFPSEDGSLEIFARTSFPFFEMLRDRASSVGAVAAYRTAELPISTRVVGRAQATFVSAGFWDVMGTKPSRGRFFDDGEAHPITGSRVVVLGHNLWQRHFAGSPDVLGQELKVRGYPYRIVGVAPRGFRGVEVGDIDIWLPLFADGDDAPARPTWHLAKTSYNLTLVARIDRSSEEAVAEVSGLYRAFLRDAYGPGGSSRDLALVARNERAAILFGPIRGGYGEDLRLLPEAKLSLWLSALALVLLAVACANLAGLQVLRTATRLDEMNIRLALGATRLQLMRQQAMEGVLLSVIGAAGGLLISRLASEAFHRRIAPTITLDPTGQGDLAVLCACAGATALVASAAGWPAVRLANRRGVLAGLSERAATFHRQRSIGVNAAIFVQVALTVVLLTGTALMFKSLYLASSEDIGMSRQSLLVDFEPGAGAPTATQIANVLEVALPRVRMIPGVIDAGLATDIPLRTARMIGELQIPGRPDVPESPTGGPYVNIVTPGFFEALSMRFDSGRAFVEPERSTGAMVVNQTLAALYFPGQDAVGRCLVRTEERTCIPIVGVVRDARRFRLGETDRYPYYYVTLPINARNSRVLILRKGPTAHLVEESVRGIFQDVAPSYAQARVRVLGDALEFQMRRWRVGSSLFLFFAVVAVVLAMVGLFAAVTSNMTARRRELATRLALGATRGALVRRIALEELTRIAVCIAGGLGLSVAARPLVADLLFGVTATDPVALLAAAGLVVLITCGAALLPILKISRASPMEGLRAG